METKWNEILMSILPFLIIIAIWMFLIRKFKKANTVNKVAYDDKFKEITGLMREIRDELKELNKNNSQKL